MLGSYEEELQKSRESTKGDLGGTKKESQFPGQSDFYSFQPPPPYYWGQPPGQMPYPYSPWQYPRPKKSIFSTVALTFGIIVMCIFWLAILPTNFGTLLLIVIIVLATLGITFGALGYSKKKEDIGLVACILSIVGLVLGMIFWSFTHISGLMY